MGDNTLAEILNEALLDEYNARDTYQKVINKFGPVRPFINIVESEQAHVDLLLPLYEKYGIPIPSRPNPEKIIIPEDLQKACENGVAAEIENVDMYKRLINATSLPDVLEVLRCLQTASRNHHLPAFKRCVKRSGTFKDGKGSRNRCGNRSRHREHY